MGPRWLMWQTGPHLADVAWPGSRTYGRAEWARHRAPESPWTPWTAFEAQPSMPPCLLQPACAVPAAAWALPTPVRGGPLTSYVCCCSSLVFFAHLLYCVCSSSCVCCPSPVVASPPVFAAHLPCLVLPPSCWGPLPRCPPRPCLAAPLQVLQISAMKNPWTLDFSRQGRLSQPWHDWEKVRGRAGRAGGWVGGWQKWQLAEPSGRQRAGNSRE